MAAFPTTITCVLARGFSEQIPQTKRYLGGKKHVLAQTAKATALIRSHADFESFMRWYITDLDWGSNNFTINLPLFGVTRDWDVRLTNTINTKPNDRASQIRDIPMELEIIDDIDTYISL